MSYQLGSIDNERRSELFAEHRDQETRLRSHRLVTVTIALLVMGLFAGGLWFAYVEGIRHAGSSVEGDIPLIRADERPTKVKPEKPGGMEIPDRDKLIYTQKRAAVEHLLPAPEKPMPRPTPPPGPLTSQQSSPMPPASPMAPVTAVAATTAAIASGAAPAEMATAAPGTPAATAPAKASPSAAMAASTRLQLGSVRSEDAARQEWDRIKRRNSDLLGGLAATPIRADLGDRGVYYRIQTGPIADADRICSELKRRNIGCIIAR